MKENITNYIVNAPDEQRKIMELIREIIHEAVPDCIENFKWSRPVFSTTHDFIYFKCEKNYFTLGIFNVNNIKDNADLLEGTGKNMRHIKIKKLDDLNIEIVKKLIRQASK